MDAVRQRRKGWLPEQVSQAGLQVWRARREMGIAGPLTSSQLEPQGSRVSQPGRDSGLGLGFGLGKALQERSALGVSARSRRRTEVRPRSFPELSSELSSDSETCWSFDAGG